MSALDKRAALAGWLEGQTANVVAGLVTQERLRDHWLAGDLPLRTLRSLYGDPLFYADVLLRGNGRSASQGRDTGRIHDYEVWLWYEYNDADTLAASSQATFDDLTYGPDGVIPALEEGCVESGGVSAQVPFNTLDAGFSEEVRIAEVTNSPTRILAHLLTFTVQLT